jgi:hypothetical protein
MSIYKKLQECRVLLQNTNLKKSGKNGHLGFSYFSLDDFIGVVNKLFLDHDLFSAFSIVTTAEGNREAELVIYHQPEGKPLETVRFSSPIADAGLKGSTAIQSLGAVHTYMRRYLYLNALEIAEPEVLDYVCGSDMIETKPIVAKELIEEATSLGIDLEKLATYLKKTVDKLTNEDLSSNIAKKRAQLAKKAKAQTSE